MLKSFELVAIHFSSDNLNETNEYLCSQSSSFLYQSKAPGLLKRVISV